MINFPEEIELWRDRRWRRESELRIERASEAEGFIEDVGFANALTDTRRAGASLFIAVCGRRDVSLPRNVQKDEECALAWHIKDEVMRRGNIYYAKLARGRSMFIAARLVKHFAAIWSMSRREESAKLSEEAKRILAVLRVEHEMATRDLREASRIAERAKLTRALDELQRAMKVVPQDVLYHPTFTYVWTLAEDRFPKELRCKVKREVALTEIARAYLAGAGMTLLGETARASGLTRTEAGLGNHRLVNEGFAVQIGRGVYRLADILAA